MSSPSVRAVTAGDAAAINRIYNHYVRATTITFDLEPWDAPRREAWIADFASGDSPYHALAAEVDGEVRGFAYNSQFRARAAYRLSTETTIYTDPENPTPGAGSALYAALFERLATTDLHRAYAVISLPNPRSIAFHRSFGFTPVGTLHQAGRKFDRYVDVAWFEKALK